MNITLGFTLDIPKVDPRTRQLVTFENVPVQEAANRVDEAVSFRVRHADDEKTAALDIVRAFQRKYPDFGKMREVSNEFGNLLIVSKGAPDNSVEAIELLGLE